MGIQLKLLFSESKDQLNIIVEDYDKVKGKVLRTMLDVVVDLESKQSNISDIDECSNEDLNLNNNFSFASNNELEKVLGEELGIEISNITGNAAPFKIASVNNEKIDESNDKSDSALAAVVSMAEKCTLSDKDEEEILNADFTKINVDKSVTNLNDTNFVRETNESDETMVEASVVTVLDEDTILNMIDTHENNEKTENNLVITDNRLKNDDQSIASASSKNKDQSTLPTSSKQKQQSIPSTSATNKEPSTPSTSRTSSRKDVRENSKSPKKVVTEGSNSPEERKGSPQSEDDCEFVIEEVLDIDSNDGDLVDLTDRENIDLLPVCTRSIHSTDAESCCGSDGIITLGNDFSDDEDEVSSQYSSARSSNRRRTGSDESLSYVDGNFVPLRRAMSDPPVKNIECVDLTNDRKCENASVSPQHRTMIERPPAEVMNDLRNFYTCNKEMIAAQKDGLRALAQRIDKKKSSGIEAPPKLSNGLPYRKRCSPVTHESDIKFSRTTQSSSLHEGNGNAVDESHREITPLNRDVPKPTCGPPGFRLNDDFGQPDPVNPNEDESAPLDPRYSHPIPNLCGQPRQPFSFRGNRRGGRTPSTARNNKFHPRMQGKWFFKRFSRNGTTKSSRSVQPTHFREEVWLDLK